MAAPHSQARNPGPTFRHDSVVAGRIRQSEPGVIDFVRKDEMVEVTPKSIRPRKKILNWDMVVATLVPVSKYLNTSYRPDCDYVDGEVLERNVGLRPHSAALGGVAWWPQSRYPELRHRVFMTLRLRVAEACVRCPDLCVLAARAQDEDAPDESVPAFPSDPCIGILAPEDGYSATMERFDDYFRMGVPVCWLVDPWKRRRWIATPGQLIEPADGILRANEIEMRIAEVVPSRA